MFYSVCCSYINSTLGRGCLVSTLCGSEERSVSGCEMRYHLVKGAVTGSVAVLWDPAADPSEGVCSSRVQTCCSRQAEPKRESWELEGEALKVVSHFSFIRVDKINFFDVFRGRFYSLIMLLCNTF